MLSLYTPIKAGYGDKKSKNNLQKQGYTLDKKLSNSKSQVYFNPSAQPDKKLLYNVSGTHSLSDWKTNLYLSAGKLKDTNRYQNAHKKLRDAKQKYGVDSAVLTGHSLGGGISSYIAQKNDQVYTLDPAYTVGAKSKKNVKNFRTSGDIVSAFSPNENTFTLSNPNLLKDPLTSHNVDNIKKQFVFIE